VRLALAAMKSTWLGGEIRTAALAVLRASAARSGARARALAREHLDLVRRERRRAEKAAAILDAWDCHQAARPAGPRLSIREAAHVLDATPDMLRNWERNGLVRVPRDPSSRHRRYGTAELERLAVIRSLRRARFSVMALLRMFQRFDAGQREGLSLALSELAAGEEDLFFSTDRWLVRLRQIEQASRAMGRLLQTLH
jgi:DNA-binding transcriptional MerR regulator